MGNFLLGTLLILLACFLAVIGKQMFESTKPPSKSNRVLTSKGIQSDGEGNLIGDSRHL